MQETADSLSRAVASSGSTALAGQETPTGIVAVRNLRMAYGNFVVMDDLNFDIQRGEVFIIMGGSGCGKSTLLRHLIGLKEPAAGTVWHDGQDFTSAPEMERQRISRNFGVLYQQGALWSAMTLAENVELPLKEYTKLSRAEIREVVHYKLALVGLRGFEEYYPAEISGGMRKRAALARAVALDPALLFFDEPSAGLDPLSSRRLDDLMLKLRDSLGTTIVVVTHELQSIFAVADRCLFLDAETRRQGPIGPPAVLRDQRDYPAVSTFLRRGE